MNLSLTTRYFGILHFLSVDHCWWLSIRVRKYMSKTVRQRKNCTGQKQCASLFSTIFVRTTNRSKTYWKSHTRYADKHVDLYVKWLVDPLLGNGSVNTFPPQRMRSQQSDNFRCYATRCKYNNRGRGVSYVVRIYPLLRNGCVFYVSASRLYK
jgi:hypothetical protein